MSHDHHRREALRLAIERRARAEALGRDERMRIDALVDEVAELNSRASLARRGAAAVAASRPWARLASDRRGSAPNGETSAPVEPRTDEHRQLAEEERRREAAARVAAALRRRRFRLARRRRVLEHGAVELRRPAIAAITRALGPRRPSRRGGWMRWRLLRIPLPTAARSNAAPRRLRASEGDDASPRSPSASIVLVAPPLAALRTVLRIVRSRPVASELVVIVQWRAGGVGAAVAEASERLAGDIAIVVASPFGLTSARLARMVEPLRSDRWLGAVAELAVSFDWVDAAPVAVAARVDPDGRSQARPAIALGGGMVALWTELLRRHPPCAAYRSDLWLTDLSLEVASAGYRLATVPPGGSGSWGETEGPPASPGSGKAPARLVASRRDAGDEALLARRWGPMLRQRVLADLLAGGGRWCPRPARVLVRPDASTRVVTDAVAGLGLERVSRPEDADVAVTVDGEGRIACDWILAGERSIAMTGAGAAESPDREAAAAARTGAGAAPGAAVASTPSLETRAVAEALAVSARAAAFCIRVGVRDWRAAGRGGDAALARSLARALGERGHQTLIQVDADADRAAGHCLDVLLVLRGRRAGEPTPGRLNLIWQISHPDDVLPPELDGYDRVLVASRRHARRLRSKVRPPVEPLLQFTDPRLFHPAPVTRRHQLAFVGNWRGSFRRIVSDALATERPLALYGRGWELLAPEHLVAEHVPHDELHRLYSSCAILLCDHWDDMREHGFISNRVFDALACETFVIADANPALADELPGAVKTYTSVEDLRRKLDRYLDDPDERERIARVGRAAVLARHTVDHRAAELLAIAGTAAAACDRPATAHLRDGDRLG